jgi:hypothetical protein
METKSKINRMDRMDRMNRIKPKYFFADSVKNIEEFKGFQVNNFMSISLNVFVSYLPLSCLSCLSC